MGTHVMMMVDERRDRLRGTLVLSLILHFVVFVIVVTYTMIHSAWAAGAKLGREWRCQNGGGGHSAGNSPPHSPADHTQHGRHPEHGRRQNGAPAQGRAAPRRGADSQIQGRG